jgi:cellulose synthase/poly-beta-1,6-N-acetylglucosamine synthase-like glycosyltransferase
MRALLAVARRGMPYAVLYAITLGLMAYAISAERVQVELGPLLWFANAIVALAFIQVFRYFFYLMVSPWHESSRPRLTRPYAPLVSVVIPAWNEEVGIVGTVDSLLKSTYRNLEILVVNDGSTDRSDAIMTRYAERFNASRGGDPARLVYRYKENGGKGSALNFGIALASGDIIMSVDADCVVDREAVGRIVSCFADPSVMAAVANVKIGNPGSFLSMVQYLEFALSFYFKKADSVLNSIYIIGGAGGAFRREVFDAVGPYNEKHITEDIDLSVRIQRAGMRIVYADRAVIYTEGASDLGGLMKQRLRWKRGRIDTFREHKALFFSADRRHGKALSWLVLPIALLGDIVLIFEPLFLLAFYAIGTMTHNFAPFFMIMALSAFMALIVFAFEREHDLKLLLLAPIAWVLSYVMALVEINAIFRSLWGMARNKEVAWQRWQRQGILPAGEKE